MMNVFYSKDASFELTDEEFNSFIKNANGKKVWIPRLNVFLSDMFIWAGKKPENDTRKLSDGTQVIRKYGTWVLTGDNSIKIDLQHYPELTKNYDPPQYSRQIPSDTQKNR
jgi:hypothetical protein